VTNGNLLFLRELVRAGLASGALAEHGGVWIWAGGFDGASRLTDLLLETVTALPVDVQRVLELLAVGEPIGTAIIEQLGSRRALEGAERAGMVVVTRSGRRLEAGLVHPIYAQVVRASLGRVRTASLARELADAIAHHGCRRAYDELRVASLQLQAGGPADAEVLLKAARQARQFADAELAEALAREAYAAGGSAAAAVTLAEVLYWLGRHEEVVALLTGGILDRAPAKEVAFGTIHLAGSLFYGLGRLADAERWLAWGIERAGAQFEADLRGTHARIVMMAGRAIEGIEEAERVLARTDASPHARLNAYIALLPALAMCGRLEAVDDHRDAALELAATAGRGRPSSTGSIVVGLFIAHIFTGRLPELDPVLRDFNEAGAQRVEDPFRGVWTFLLGRSALMQGRLADAVPALREGAALLRLRDPGMMLPWCLAALTQALGASDDARAARAACDELAAVRFEVTRNIDLEVGLARAWAAAAAGNRSDAARIALEVAGALRDDGRFAVAAMGYHEALRLGTAASAVVGPLNELADHVDGPVVAAMAAHANALVGGGARDLAGVAGTFEAAGMMLHAAEVMVTASLVAASAGLRASAGEYRARAATLAARCGAALTPLLEPISDRDSLGILTRKEQEVALMAARGMTKRDIAESLTVSVRTVGNHINHVYAKLGVTTRAELRAVLNLEREGAAN
jgi:DNA-binding CsgD family transcriptional regulator